MHDPAAGAELHHVEVQVALADVDRRRRSRRSAGPATGGDALARLRRVEVPGRGERLLGAADLGVHRVADQPVDQRRCAGQERREAVGGGEVVACAGVVAVLADAQHGAGDERAVGLPSGAGTGEAPRSRTPGDSRR
jgi:hypothetical protein